MKVLLSGGGTAGHVNPAISIAQAIRQKKPNTEFLFVGKKNGIEQKLVTKAGFDIKFIDIDGIDRKHLLKNVKTAVKAFRSTADAKKIIKEFKPDVVIGTGGHVSFPTVNAACKIGIPTAIHEQNAFPGVTSKILAKRVDKVMLGFADAAKYLSQKADTILVGNPIREGFVFANKENARAKLGIEDDAKCIVSFGGSLGAREFNKVIAEFMGKHAPIGKYVHIHACGAAGYKWMPQLLESYGVSAEKYPQIKACEYIDNMQDVMAAADVIISRAGAITLAEITALGKPSVLIPSPNVTHNHQFYNAKSLADKNAAILIEEKDLTADLLCEKIDDIFSSEDIVRSLSANAFEMAVPDSGDKIYSIISQLVR